MSVFAAATALAMAAFTLHVGAGLGDPDLHTFFDSWVYIGLMLAATSACLLRARLIRAERAAWRAMGVGMLLWTVGEIYWLLALSGLDTIPVPSPADGFYLAFYPLSYVALGLLVRARVPAFSRSQWLDGAIVASAVAAVVAALAFRPIMEASEGSAVAVATNLAYPIGDLVLLALVVGVFGLSGWRPGRAWLLLGAGVGCMGVADVAYLLQSAAGTYEEGMLVDVAWPAAALLVGLAAWRMPQAPRRSELEGRRVIVVPVVAGVVAIGLTILCNFHSANGATLLFTTVTLLLVTVRMAVAFIENQRESRQQLQAILDHTPAAIYTKDLSGRYMIVNRKAATFAGVSVEDMVGRTDGELFPSELAEGLVALDQRALESDELVVAEHEIPTAEGPRTFLSQEFPLRDDGGAVYAVCGIATDITERVRADEANRRLEQELHRTQRLETVGRLAGGVAHDFNNLLAVIINYAAMAREQVPDASSVKEDLGEIEGAAKRGAELTRELLTFSSQGQLDGHPVDVNAVVRGAERLLRATMGEDIALSIELAPELPPVELDAGQLERALLNLAVNARGAMPTGGSLTIRTERVELSHERAAPAGLTAGRYVRLEVSDTGCGMSQEVAQKAFDPFFTTKPVGEGSGLGLASVYGIVSQAGGGVQLDSSLGHGTAVAIHLPASEGTVLAPPETSPTRPPTAERRVVLVVEDEVSVGRVISRMLARHGYVVEQAKSSYEALDVCSDAGKRIDLVLTDLVLPSMSGGELAQRVQHLRPDLSFLFMSGYPDDVRLRHAIPHGQPYLQKPFTSAELLNRVGMTLRAARAGGTAA